MPMATKLSVCALILLGSLGSVASIARIVITVPESAPNAFGQVTMQTRSLSVQFSCVLETGTGIVCLAMAALRPLYRVLVQKWKAGMGHRSCSIEQASSTGESIELNENGSKEKLTKFTFTHGKDLIALSDDDLLDGTRDGGEEESPPEDSWCGTPESAVEMEKWDHIDAAEKGEAHMTS
ncbi:hypothetical protein BDV97DRAFT_368401 [Delphinella strobiligena]|nr:hypothetical protein BDV97DRAFT_368401 [Delphinella strobiligena]